jgi:type III restriction enzyme
MRPERDALEIQFPRVQGYRVELPNERLEATFNEDSTLLLTPDLVGPSITNNSGFIGESVDLSLKHLEDVRQSTLLFQLTRRLLYNHFRDPNQEPELHLFGQLKRIAKQWLDNYLICKGGTYPAQLVYQELADMACARIHAAITRRFLGEQPIRAVLDPYNPSGSTQHVNFYTSKPSRWQTDSRRCQVNWVVLDSDWEGELCRVVEAQPRVRAYVKNQGLGLEVPYLYGSTPRKYIPDFIVQVEDGQADPINLIVEIKGYRGEDAKEKKATMETYWVPGVNHLGSYGRWAFLELKDVFMIEQEFKAWVEKMINEPMDAVSANSGARKTNG